MKHDAINATLRAHAGYLGRNIHDVARSLSRSMATAHGSAFAGAVADLNASKNPPAPQPDQDTWYTGSATVSGLIRGTCTAGVYFGTSGNYKFSGSMWTGPIGATGGGGGAWSVVPDDGQDMDFTWWGISVDGGAVNIMWMVDEIIVGSMAIAVAGIGGGGGHGSGTWTQGD